MMTPALAMVICTSLAISEAVQLEVVKLIALCVTTGASLYAARIATKNRTAINRRRKEVRELDDPDGRVLVIEERRSSPGERRSRSGTRRTDGTGTDK
jgi:hypothetical protein